MTDIDIDDPDWDCPHCGDNGLLMHRPGSKDTCANCFWVVDGNFNDYELTNFDLTYRQAQRLLNLIEEPWHGSPGNIETRLYALFGFDDLNALLADLRGGD